MSPALATALVVARRIGIVLTFVIVLLRPGVGEADVATQLADVDVLVVVDRTRSMAALDYEDRQPRIAGVEEDLTELAEELPGARFAMLSFGSESRLTLPFSSDVSAFIAAAETIDIEGPREGSGSRADRPVPDIVEVLERAAEQRPERRRIVVYVGDGEDTATGGTDESFEDIADLVVGGVVLGYGTTKGASMPSADDLDPEDGFVTDPDTDSTAISRADLDNLEEIADELDVEFLHRTRPGGLDRVAESFGASYVDGERSDERPAKHDLTWVFGLLLLGLLLLELRAAWRAVWGSQRTLLPTARKGAE